MVLQDPQKMIYSLKSSWDVNALNSGGEPQEGSSVCYNISHRVPSSSPSSKSGRAMPWVVLDEDFITSTGNLVAGEPILLHAIKVLPHAAA